MVFMSILKAMGCDGGQEERVILQEGCPLVLGKTWPELAVVSAAVFPRTRNFLNRREVFQHHMHLIECLTCQYCVLLENK